MESGFSEEGVLIGFDPDEHELVEVQHAYY